MNNLIIDCISGEVNTTGNIIDSSVINLLDGEEVVGIYASNITPIIITEHQVDETIKNYYIISNGDRSIPYDEMSNVKSLDDDTELLYTYRVDSQYRL